MSTGVWCGRVLCIKLLDSDIWRGNNLVTQNLKNKKICSLLVLILA